MLVAPKLKSLRGPWCENVCNTYMGTGKVTNRLSGQLAGDLSNRKTRHEIAECIRRPMIDVSSASGPGTFRGPRIASLTQTAAP